MEYCSICQKGIEKEEPVILTMGGFAHPRYICDECAALIDQASLAKEYDTITEAMDRLGALLAKNDDEDYAVVETMEDIMLAARVRADAIRDGKYDFSRDETDEEEFEITPDLLETEEDRELDRKDKEAEARLDKFMNWAWVGFGVAFVAYLVWFFFLR